MWCAKLKIVLILALFASTNLKLKDVKPFNDTIGSTQRVRPRIKRERCRVPYYANTTATFNIILSGDIEINPGPIRRPKKTTATPCTKCNKTIRCNQKSLLCNVCIQSAHTKCIFKKFNNKTPSQQTWICHQCTHTQLPFYNCDFSDANCFTLPNQPEKAPLKNVHLENLNKSHNHISIAHLNTQSLTSTFDEFQLMLNLYKFDIMTLSETWLKNDKNMLNYVEIPGYDFLYKNREGKKGGGVGTYVNTTSISKYKIRNDINDINRDIEHLWIEVKRKSEKQSILLGTFYQPTFEKEATNEWLTSFNKLLFEVKLKWHGAIVIAGDFNINYLNTASTTTEIYQDILDRFELHNCVTTPTRRGTKLIDHILTNTPSKIGVSDVLPCPLISDHDAPYITLHLKPDRYEKRYKYIRSYKKFNASDFITDFSGLPFSIIYSFNDPDEQLHLFNKLVKECIDRHAPLKRVLLTRPPAPWMKDLNIVQLQKERDKLRYISHQQQTNENWLLFRQKRNEIKSVIKQTKTMFYRKALSANRPKEIWKTINRILNPPPNRIKEDPNKLNNHFNSTAERITSQKPNQKHHLKSFIHNLPNLSPDSFKLRKVSYRDIEKELNSLRNDTSCGYDNIPVNLIKLVRSNLISPLTYIINNFISEQSFPTAWKIARISPVPKSNHPTSLNDYRPISVLPILSKVYEKVVLNQVSEFIENQLVYNMTQSGFRKSHSTLTILTKFRDDIQAAMKKGEVTLAVFTDYSKAFDTLHFKTLLKRLHQQNFSKSFLYWVCEYLTERYHYVQIDDRRSTRMKINFGVPQGSILGPVLFNLYVTSLNSVLNSSKSIQYADDSTIYCTVSPKAIHQSIENIRSDLQRVTTWSLQSNLSFNATKTKFLLFSTPKLRKLHNLNQISIQANDTILSSVASFKLLGVYFDQSLTWKTQINHLMKECFSKISILKRVKRILPYQTRKYLIQSLVLSKLDYGIQLLSNIPKYQENRLQKIINAASSFINNRYSTTNDSLKLRFLSIKERRSFQLAKLVHKSLYDDHFPIYLKQSLKTPPRHLRGSHEPQLEVGLKGTFFGDSAELFNNLPHAFRRQTDFHIFKNNVFNYLLDQSIARNL